MTEEATIPTTGGIGIKAPSNLDWGQSADFEQINKDADIFHKEVYGPIVQKVMTAATGQGTPEDNIEVANVFKTANEARIGDVLAGIFKADPLKVYVGLTGGADQAEAGFDGAGNNYAVIYNQRGELRGYKNRTTGKYLTEQELAQIEPNANLLAIKNASPDKLLMKLEDGSVDYAVVNEAEFAAHRAAFPELKTKTVLSEIKLAWALRPQDQHLLKLANYFLQRQFVVSLIQVNYCYVE